MVTDNGAIDIGDGGSGAILVLDDGTTITGDGTGTLTISADDTLDVEHGGNDRQRRRHAGRRAW